MAEEEGELEALRQKVAELQKLLKSKVWTAAAATISNMEEATMGSKMDAEQATLPRRIANLEKSVFGRSASEADLEHWNSIEDEMKKLQSEYEALKLEYIKERDKPPEVIKQDDGRTKQLEKDFKKMQGMYQMLNSKYTTLNVDYLKMETDFEELTKAHEQLLEEATKLKDESGSKTQRSQEQQTKMALELKRLRAANGKLWEEHQQLQSQHSRVAKDLQALQQMKARFDTKENMFDDLEAECELLRQENDDLRGKSIELRKKLGMGSFHNPAETRRNSRVGFGAGSRAGSKETTRESTMMKGPAMYATTQALTSFSRPAVSADVAPQEEIQRAVSLPRLPALDDISPKKTLEDEDQDFFSKFPELREPKEQIVDVFQSRMFAINGRVKYCNEKWQEWYFKSSSMGPGLTLGPKVA